jgi:hypothetical protein
MASNNCPACESHTAPKFLTGLSQGTHVHYWRCPRCHHVWTTPQDGQEVLRHVTPLPAKPKTDSGQNAT